MSSKVSGTESAAGGMFTREAPLSALLFVLLKWALTPAAQCCYEPTPKLVSKLLVYTKMGKARHAVILKLNSYIAVIKIINI